MKEEIKLFRYTCDQCGFIFFSCDDNEAPRYWMTIDKKLLCPKCKKDFLDHIHLF